MLSVKTFIIIFPNIRSESKYIYKLFLVYPLSSSDGMAGTSVVYFNYYDCSAIIFDPMS